MADRILFRAHRSQILPALDACFEAVDTRSTIPILENVLLTPKGAELMMRSTDLGIEVETSCDLLDVSSSQPITLSGAGLRDIVKNLPESAEITFEAGAYPDQVRIHSGRSRFSLLSLSEKDFPSIGSKLDAAPMQWDIAPLIEAMSRVTYAIRDDKTRTYLSGTYLHPHDAQGVSVVGCDGHNLAVVRIAAGEEVSFPGVILPIKTAKALKKLFGEAKGRAEVTVTSEMMRVAMNGVTLISKVVDGVFPDYTRLIPARSNHAAIASVATLKAAVSRVGLIANDLEKDTIRLQVADSALTVSMKTSGGEDASEDIPVDYDGAPIDIGFNGKYLTAMLASVGTQDVEMHLSDPTTPGLFRPTIERDQHFVLMPKRL